MVFTTNIPYTYLIGWSKLNMRYYGRRTAKDCHPDEFWITYFTSSDKVKEFRDLNGEPDIVQIRKRFTGEDRNVKCAVWEETVIDRIGAVKSSQWLNKKGSKFDTAGMMVAKDQNNNIVFVPVDDERLLTGELVHASKGNKHETNQCQHCKTHISVQNLERHELTCEKNVNQIHLTYNTSTLACTYCQASIVLNNIKQHTKSCKQNPNRVPGNTYGMKYNVSRKVCQYCSKEIGANGFKKHENYCKFKLPSLQNY
jgi:hypothetical protein